MLAIRHRMFVIVENNRAQLYPGQVKKTTCAGCTAPKTQCPGSSRISPWSHLQFHRRSGSGGFVRHKRQTERLEIIPSLDHEICPRLNCV